MSNMGITLTQPNSLSSSIYENVSAHPECLISFSAVRNASSPMTSCEPLLPPLPCADADTDDGAVTGMAESGAKGALVLLLDGSMVEEPPVIATREVVGGCVGDVC